MRTAGTLPRWEKMSIGALVAIFASVALFVVLRDDAAPDERADLPSMAIDDGFDANVSSAVQGGGSVRLRELTTFDWETVSVFTDGTTRREVRDETGVDILNDPYLYSRALFVFCADDMVVALRLYGFADLYQGDRLTYSRDAVLEGGRLVEPTGGAVRARCL